MQDKADGADSARPRPPLPHRPRPTPAARVGPCPPPGRLLSRSLGPALPALVTLAGLGLAGVIRPGWITVPAMLVVLLGTALVIRPRLRDLAAVERTTRRLAERRCEGSATSLGGGMTPVLVHDSLARAQFTAVQDLDRACRRRLGEIAARAGSDALVVDALPDPILLIDREATVIRVNAGARALFGRDGMGRPLTLLLRDPAVLEAAETVLDGAGARSTQITLPGAVERVFEVRVGPLPQRDPDGAEAMVSLHDVSRLVRLERMRADFVANASHELRTPLSSVVGFVETLMGPARDDPEARERFLAIMLEQGRRMQRLVEDLLSLSRIEINEHSPPTGSVDLPPLVRSIVAGLELKTRAKSMLISVDLDDALPPVVGDADQLSQVFQNLLDNAVKYGRPKTAITISGGVVARGPAGMPPPPPVGAPGGMPGTASETGTAWRQAPCLHVSVADQGEGIEREHLPRLTERFYRVDRARSREMGGTGLGLAIVKHVLARHRGMLVPDSRPGLGSTFHVYLPLHPDAIVTAASDGTA